MLPATAARIATALRDEAVECLEDPVPKARPEWWALLRQKSEIPLALHSSDGRLIMEMARWGGIDYVNVGGSPNVCRAAAAVAEAAGCPVWVQFEGHCLDIAAHSIFTWPRRFPTPPGLGYSALPARGTHRARATDLARRLLCRAHRAGPGRHAR